MRVGVCWVGVCMLGRVWVGGVSLQERHCGRVISYKETLWENL